MPTTTIDIHPHIIANDAARYPLAPLGGHQSDWSRTRPVTLGQLIAAMDKAGVQKAAIVQASTCYGHDNSYVADAVAAHPDRFTGVFSVDVLASDAPQHMRACCGRGLTGMASELRLPAIYPFRYFAENGGLASYGFNTVEQHRGAATYVDRILKGERPGDLPVQSANEV